MAEQKYRWNYAKPREIRGGIRSRSRRGRISAANWWSARWMRILEECIDSGRISRGRSYARKGQVTSIEIEPGLVTAFVQGTRKKPYQIKLGFETVAEKEKELLLLRFREHASFAARLLADHGLFQWPAAAWAGLAATAVGGEFLFEITRGYKLTQLELTRKRRDNT